METEQEVFGLIRESRWVKEYGARTGRILDSKYRTFQCDLSADQFVEIWNEADDQERTDMEAAFSFFPAESKDAMESILMRLRCDDPERIEGMRRAWTVNAGGLTAEQTGFQLALESYLDKSGVPRDLVGSNKWFRVLANDAAVQIETFVKRVEEMPSDEELEALERSTSSPAYRHALRLVRGCRFLLAPEYAFQPGRSKGGEPGKRDDPENATGPENWTVTMLMSPRDDGR